MVICRGTSWNNEKFAVHEPLEYHIGRSITKHAKFDFVDDVADSLERRMHVGTFVCDDCAHALHIGLSPWRITRFFYCLGRVALVDYNDTITRKNVSDTGSRIQREFDVASRPSRNVVRVRELPIMQHAGDAQRTSHHNRDSTNATDELAF